MKRPLTVINPNSIDFSDFSGFAGIVTPDVAAQLLERNHKDNRSISLTRVRRYRRLIENGMWGIGDAIYFSDNGVLINGQHRLSAIVESGIPVPVAFMTGYPIESAEVMDQGANRTTAHVIQLRGKTPNNTATAIIRMVVTVLAENNWEFTFSPREVANLIDYYDDGLEFACKHTGMKESIKYAPALAPVFMAYYDDVDRERLEDFLVCWHSGTVIGGKSDNSAMLLRSAYYKSKAGEGARTQRIAFFRKSQNALSHFVKGESPKTLKEVTRLVYGSNIFSKESLRAIAKGK